MQGESSDQRRDVFLLYWQMRGLGSPTTTACIRRIEEVTATRRWENRPDLLPILWRIAVLIVKYCYISELISFFHTLNRDRESSLNTILFPYLYASMHTYIYTDWFSSIDNHFHPWIRAWRSRIGNLYHKWRVKINLHNLYTNLFRKEKKRDEYMDRKSTFLGNRKNHLNVFNYMIPWFLFFKLWLIFFFFGFGFGRGRKVKYCFKLYRAIASR